MDNSLDVLDVERLLYKAESQGEPDAEVLGKQGASGCVGMTIAQTVRYCLCLDGFCEDTTPESHNVTTPARHTRAGMVQQSKEWHRPDDSR